MPKLDRLLSLNCFILDERDDPNDIFQVVIESTKTVQNLKEAILTQRRFRDMPVDVKDLRLWSKIIPIDSNFKITIGNISLVENYFLLSMDPLSKIFPNSITGRFIHLLIRVDHPSIGKPS